MRNILNSLFKFIRIYRFRNRQKIKLDDLIIVTCNSGRFYIGRFQSYNGEKVTIKRADTLSFDIDKISVSRLNRIN